MIFEIQQQFELSLGSKNLRIIVVAQEVKIMINTTLSPTDLQKIHDFCVSTAQYVGGYLEAHFGYAKAERKGGQIPVGVDPGTYDVVTDVDLNIQRQIATLLLEQYPTFEFYGEEKPEKVFEKEDGNIILDRIKNNRSIYQFVVDPLDGTGRYRDKDARFGFLLGLLENENFVVCVAYNPKQQLLTSAVKGLGCWRNGQKFVFQSTVDDHIVINSKADRIEDFKRALTTEELFIIRPKHTGTMYDMLFLQYAPFFVSMKTNTHDHVLTLAVEEAGGTVLVYDGKRFVESTEHNWRSEWSKKDANIPAIIAANSREKADRIKKIVLSFISEPSQSS